MEAVVDVDKAIDGGVTPLHITAHNGHEVVVWVLVEVEADVNQARGDGREPGEG